MKFIFNNTNNSLSLNIYYYFCTPKRKEVSMNTEEEFYIELGLNISKIRNKKEISQEGLADFLKLSRPSIANIEKGRQRPNVLTLALIANYLKVDISELIPTLKGIDLEKIDLVGIDTLNKEEFNKESLNSFLQTIIRYK